MLLLLFIFHLLYKLFHFCLLYFTNFSFTNISAYNSVLHLRPSRNLSLWSTFFRIPFNGGPVVNRLSFFFSPKNVFILPDFLKHFYSVKKYVTVIFCYILKILFYSFQILSCLLEVGHSSVVIFIPFQLLLRFFFSFDIL